MTPAMTEYLFEDEILDRPYPSDTLVSKCCCATALCCCTNSPSQMGQVEELAVLCEPQAAN